MNTEEESFNWHIHESLILSTDEWTKKYAPQLESEIQMHINNSDNPVRYIMMSIRNWIDAGCVCMNSKASIMGKGGYACGDCGKRRLNGNHK